VSAPLSTSGDQGDGVKVHGHWTIQVLNADGSLAVREEFENALSADGANAIARLLGRGASAGWWGVELAAAPSATTGPCGVSNGTPVPCWIFEPAITNVAPGASSTNLVVTEPGSGGAPSLTMSGSVGTSAATASQIDIVGTHLMRCSPSTAPSAPCGAPGIAGTLRFTSHTLATPIPLQPGQFVQVTVVISFS